MKLTKPLVLIILIFAFLAMIVSFSISKRNAETKLQRAIETSLEQAVNELKIRLEKHSYLPSLLSNDSEIISFLNTKKSDSDYINIKTN